MKEMWNTQKVLKQKTGLGCDLEKNYIIGEARKSKEFVQVLTIIMSLVCFHLCYPNKFN